MNTSEIVLGIIANHTKANVGQVTPATTLSSLAIDSLGMVELIFALEDRFDIEIPESTSMTDRFASFRTAGDVVRAVDELVLRHT
jgi:acyl carrier protein